MATGEIVATLVLASGLKVEGAGAGVGAGSRAGGRSKQPGGGRAASRHSRVVLPTNPRPPPSPPAPLQRPPRRLRWGGRCTRPAPPSRPAPKPCALAAWAAAAAARLPRARLLRTRPGEQPWARHPLPQIWNEQFTYSGITEGEDLVVVVASGATELGRASVSLKKVFREGCARRPGPRRHTIPLLVRLTSVPA